MPTACSFLPTAFFVFLHFFNNKEAIGLFLLKSP